jgi:hypothetical protein
MLPLAHWWDIFGYWLFNDWWIKACLLIFFTKKVQAAKVSCLASRMQLLPGYNE